MFLYPNRERWFLYISRRNNWINIIKYSFFFNWYRFFNRWVIFKPLLFREFVEDITIRVTRPEGAGLLVMIVT